MKCTQPAKIFYSYAHADELLRDELEKHLSILKQQGFVTEWHDRNISAGTEWAREIDSHLEAAQIILLLISPDFLASQYCYGIEMTRAMERHNTGKAWVIPIILRPIDWKGAPFGKLQMLPTDAQPITSWSDRDAAFVSVAIGIRKTVEKLSILPLTPHFERTAPSYRSESSRFDDIFSSPYRGLFAFREQDAPFFFGRETFSEMLVESVRKKPFVAVIGPSGCGKSSLVFAGLLPRLHYDGTWRIASMRPGNRPFRTLASAVLPLLEAQMDEIDRLARINKLAEPLQQGEISLYDIIERIMQKQSISRLLLFIDQFEELFTFCQSSEDRQCFIDTLLETVHAVSRYQRVNFTLIITLRADFLGQALLNRSIADVLQHNDVKLSPMKQQELYDAIEKPARQLNAALEEGLAKRIVLDINREPGKLPLLEFTLTLLWEKRQNGILKHSAYGEIGGVEQALATYAEELYVTLTREEQQMVQKVFLQLVHPGEGTEDTRRMATRAQIGKEAWSVIMRLSDARLVVCGQDEITGEEIVEITHEALITGWKRLSEWVENNRDFRSWQEHLRAALRQWEKSKRDDGALLHGALLAEARQWMVQRGEEVNQSEQLFIEASQQFQEREAQRWKTLYEEAEQRRKFELLYEAGEALGKIGYLMQLDQAYAIIEQIAARQNQCHVVIRRYDNNTEELILRYVSSELEGFLPAHVKVNEGLDGRVAHERRTSAVSNVNTTQLDLFLAKSISPAIQSVIITPILFEDHYYGNIEFLYQRHDHFHESDIGVFEALAQQLASTIYRLRATGPRQEETPEELSVQERNRVNSLISEFVHQLGNDLGLVPLYLEEIRKQLESQEVADPLILKRLEQIVQLVQNGLDKSRGITKITSNETIIEDTVAIQPRELFEEVCSSIPLSDSISVSLEIGEDIVPLRGMRSLLLDSLRNLMLNAIQAMPSGGKLILRAKSEEFFVVLEVSDTGKGIPPEQLSQIFNLSFSTKGSSGFGLWSARRNADRNQGNLQVKSQVGEGTTFTLLVPRADRET